MPIRRFRKRRAPRRGRRVGRRPARRHPQQTSGNIRVKQYARCVEAIPITAIAANTDYNYQFNISDFPRASLIAKNFKYYRAKYVVWTYIPEYNTFQSSVGNSTMPQMSMIMNRTGDNTLWTPADYDAQGAVPKAFSRKRVIKYKPNLCSPLNVTLSAVSPDPTPTPTTGTLGNIPVYDKWVGTGGYAVDNTLGGATELIIRSDKTPYYGHSAYWYVSTVGNTLPLATVFCEVEWEFKDPMYVAPTTTTDVPQ